MPTGQKQYSFKSKRNQKQKEKPYFLKEIKNSKKNLTFCQILQQVYSDPLIHATCHSQPDQAFHNLPPVRPLELRSLVS